VAAWTSRTPKLQGWTSQQPYFVQKKENDRSQEVKEKGRAATQELLTKIFFMLVFKSQIFFQD